MLAECAKVRKFLLDVFLNLLVTLSKAEWMNPFTAGTLALEHAPARTILLWVIRRATDAVDCLIVARVLLHLHERVHQTLKFRPNEIFALLWTIHVATDKSYKHQIPLDNDFSHQSIL